MKAGKISFVRPWPAPKWLVFGFGLVALIGFLDAAYLTVKHYIGGPVECSFLRGCDTVLTSSYATIGGLPVALLGGLYYFLILLLTTLYWDTGDWRLWQAATLSTSLGFLATVWFFFLQFFIIKAVCLYCLISAASSGSLFILAAFYFLGTPRRIYD